MGKAEESCKRQVEEWKTKELQDGLTNSYLMSVLEMTQCVNAGTDYHITADCPRQRTVRHRLLGKTELQSSDLDLKKLKVEKLSTLLDRIAILSTDHDLWIADSEAEKSIRI